jgi:hypothetical protein
MRRKHSKERQQTALRGDQPTALFVDQDGEGGEEKQSACRGRLVGWETDETVSQSLIS